MSDNHRILGLTGDEHFLIEAAKNIIEMYKAGGAEKAATLKYFGVICTLIITAMIGLARFGETPARDHTVIGALGIILYVVGVTVLRKLFAIRQNTVMLCVELGNIYRLYIARYPDLEKGIGKSFRLYDENTPRISLTGSDFFGMMTVSLVNTVVLLAALASLISGLEKLYELNMAWALHYILNPLAILGNVALVFWFCRLTKH